MMLSNAQPHLRNPHAQQPSDDVDTLEALLTADLNGHPRPERITAQLDRLERLVDHAPGRALPLGRRWTPDPGHAGTAARALLGSRGLRYSFDADLGWSLQRT